ncbi:unnamed protein product [Mytilus coruscus]|uniref:Mutator-like transposase domain-containing protein n=1 Tax=Mytilus coruscus TaxID=42192 RepID=A0A6J8EUG8_MYTCO|nr:unnamed protein product [Mytilus coruscus]
MTTSIRNRIIENWEPENYVINDVYTLIIRRPYDFWMLTEENPKSFHTRWNFNGDQTGKVVRRGTRSSDCRVWKARNVETYDHKCTSNWFGSANGLEPDVRARLIGYLENKNFQVSTVIMDDDTTTMARIRYLKCHKQECLAVKQYQAHNASDVKILQSILNFAKPSASELSAKNVSYQIYGICQTNKQKICNTPSVGSVSLRCGMWDSTWVFWGKQDSKREEAACMC